MKSNFYITAYLMLLISLGYIATDIYLPSLPALAIYFNASDYDVQMTLFSYMLSFSFSPIIFGPLSDHVGRKKVILGGIIISFLATIGCLFAQNIHSLSIARFIQGFGMGAVMIASRATVSDLFIGKALGKQMSYMTMLMPIIFSLAPTLGGVLQERYQWQSIFLFLSIYLVFILILALIKTESLKSPSQEKISQIFSTYRSHLKNRLFLQFGVNFILPSFGLFGYWTVSPFLFQEILGLSPFEYGALSLYIGGTIMAVGFINLKLIHRLQVTQVLYMGGALALFAGCLIIFFHFMGILNLWSMLIPTLIFFTCIPLCISNGASKALSFVHGQFGAASALLTTCQFLFGALGTFIFSWVPHESALSLGICFAVIGFLSLLNIKYACFLEKGLQPTKLVEV